LGIIYPKIQQPTITETKVELSTMSGTLGEFMSEVRILPAMHRPRLAPISFANQPHVMAYRQRIFDAEKAQGNIPADAVLGAHVGVVTLARSDSEAVRDVVASKATVDMQAKLCTDVVHTALCGVLSGDDMVVGADGAGVADDSFDRAGVRSVRSRLDSGVAADDLKQWRADGSSREATLFDDPRVLVSGPTEFQLPVLKPEKDVPGGAVLPSLRAVDERLSLIGGSTEAVITDPGACVRAPPCLKMTLGVKDMRVGVPGSECEPLPVQLLEKLPDVTGRGARRMLKEPPDGYRGVPELRNGWVDALPDGLGSSVRAGLSEAKASGDRHLERVVAGLLNFVDTSDSRFESTDDAHEHLALKRVIEAGYARFLAMCRANTNAVWSEARLDVDRETYSMAERWKDHPAQAALDGHTHIAVLEPVLLRVFGRTVAASGRFGYVRRLSLCVPNASLVAVLRALEWAVLDRFKGHVFVEDTIPSRLLSKGGGSLGFSVMPRGIDMSAVGLLEKKIAELFFAHVGVYHTRGCGVCERET